MLELIGAAPSVFVRATRLACEEKGVPYALTVAAPHSPPVLAISPFGKIPVMRHEDFELFESSAIIEYIDAVFPGPRLFPEDARVAAVIRQWASAVVANIFPALGGYLYANAFPKGPGGRPDPEVINALLPGMRVAIGSVDRSVAGGYLAGNAFSVADMYLMPMLAYLKVFPESAAALAQSPALARYYEQHAARPSFRATKPPPLPGAPAAAD
ncbi:MAG TPA: glutathione S-transferase family protein [Steroidobacteraceae bacterium]|nr:glutathione S-transferase family protein [Steroidobacteraceae bacterium]